MDIYTAYAVLDKQISNVIDALNILDPIPDPVKPDYVRLEESPFILTEEAKRCCDVVTAHDLNQYKSRFHSIRMEDDVRTWLDKLLEIDEREELEV